ARVQDFARGIDREVATGLATRMLGEPLPHDAEIEVIVDLAGPVNHRRTRQRLPSGILAPGRHYRSAPSEYAPAGAWEGPPTRPGRRAPELVPRPPPISNGRSIYFTIAPGGPGVKGTPAGQPEESPVSYHFKDVTIDRIGIVGSGQIGPD